MASTDTAWKNQGIEQSITNSLYDICSRSRHCNEPFASVRQVFTERAPRSGEVTVDHTAVGRAVYELIRNAEVSWGIRSVSITAGHAAVMDDHGGWLVPKKDLVGVLQVLLQNRRIQVAPALQDATTLVNELTQFQLKTVPIKPDAAIEWRERPHDDLVLAVAIAAWQAEKYVLFFFADI